MIGTETPIGERTDRVTLQLPGAAVPDGDGGMSQTWTDVPPSVMARVRAATAEDLERLAAGTQLSTLSRLIRFPYRGDLTTTMRLTWTDRGGAHVANVSGVQITSEGTELEVIAVEVVP